MKKILLACAALLIALGAPWCAPEAAAQMPGTPAGKAAPKQQQDLDKIYRDLRGEWRRSGPGFACDVTSPQQLPPSERLADALYYACLHMGRFAIRGEAAALKTLGTPARSVPQPKGATAWVYLPEAPWPSPYLVATVLNDRIVALQISGQTRAKGFSFNHINLGDGTETLLKHFGSPKHIGPSGRKDADLWEYKPWTFTFEIENDRVTSIRIADPTY